MAEAKRPRSKSGPAAGKPAGREAAQGSRATRRPPRAAAVTREGGLRCAPVQMDQIAGFVDILTGAYPFFMTNREQALKGFQEVCKIGYPELIGAFEKNGRIAGTYALYSFAATILGRGLPAAGLGIVASALDRKKQRIALRLVRDFAGRCRRGGYPISLLYPFEHDFYAEMGWGLVGESKQYSFPPQALPLYPERRQVRWVREVDWAVLDRIHRQSLGRQQALGLSRAPSRWTLLLRQEQMFFLAGPEHAPDGYALARFSPRAGESDKFRYDLEVMEMEWTTPSALRGMLGFLSSQRDQVMHIALDWPRESNLEAILSEPVQHAAPNLRGHLKQGPTIARGAMLRLEDPQTAFALRPYRGADAVGLEVHTTDPLARNRPIVFRTLLRGDAANSRGRGRPLTARLDTSLATLSRLWAGAIHFQEALDFALIGLDPPGAAAPLDRLFSVPRPWIVERF